MDHAGFRKLVSDKYKTDASFALAMGWTPQKVTKMMYGRYVPKITEAAKMSEVLSTPIATLASFFKP